ncbi:transcriptional regulator [Ameyamaea chiangmaiensis NBRC 103196]|uniref:LysR family transcriptional regulator n=1 Tax=Ameyamaea chiangmaiensis TaxID=442969 RepID=A0A850PGM0_9PROT|nr:LysR family transcriptional regulator [Ameyamaea chiangmaiensis]MBS4075295.1 LysR family transcriptional regulator [Ameyamaea chiangmaiensis]NVN41032.1 LysR family transcriptional regulator [Ameyamaea chiangmaiensis]GBQ66678.1 transcriptional regulator [Ameyamaea chiangmaiensis NBRC 103196]
MDLRHLRYFVAVAEELNFTRAAVRVGIGQPPLSQQIRDLERDLGVALFVRRPQGVVLTEAGTAFLPEARLVLEGAERARERARLAQQGHTGHLSLGLTSSAAFNTAVSHTVRRFRQAWPNVTLRLMERNSVYLLERMYEGELDAAFYRPGLSDPEGLRLLRLRDEPMRVILPISHPLAAQRTLHLSALAEESFVMFPRDTGLSLFDNILTACRAAGFEPRVAQEAPQISSVVNLVAAELGVSIVPVSISSIRVDGVVYRRLAAPAPMATLGLAAPLNAALRGRSVLVDNLFGLLDGQ